MELIKDLELVAVEREGQKAILKFIDMDEGIVRPVNFNKQSWDTANGKFIDDEEKAAKVEEWCEEHFGLKFDDLEKAIGTKKDIYVYDNFNSLFEIELIEKFTKEMEGSIFQTQITEIGEDDVKLFIRYQIEGKTYETKMTHGDYIEELGKWFADPQKRQKQLGKFEDKFGVPFVEKDKLIGRDIMVEVKKAFGNWLYGDIKKLK